MERHSRPLDVEETAVRLSGLTKGVAGWRMLGAASVDAAVVGELSPYGQLIDKAADDLKIHTPAILPELLEEYVWALI